MARYQGSRCLAWDSFQKNISHLLRTTPPPNGGHPCFATAKAMEPYSSGGDTPTFIFPTNDRHSGTVLSADPDKGIIEVGGVRLGVEGARHSSLAPSLFFSG
jgi:hypothetical protein